MKLTFANGTVKRLKVGDAVPFYSPIVKVEWNQDDIIPDREKFLNFMQNEVYPKFIPTEVVYTAEAKSGIVIRGA
jgi:hypothetical protein